MKNYQRGREGSLETRYTNRIYLAGFSPSVIAQRRFYQELKALEIYMPWLRDVPCREKLVYYSEVRSKTSTYLIRRGKRVRAPIGEIPSCLSMDGCQLFDVPYTEWESGPQRGGGLKICSSTESRRLTNEVCGALGAETVCLTEDSRTQC